MQRQASPENNKNENTSTPDKNKNSGVQAFISNFFANKATSNNSAALNLALTSYTPTPSEADNSYVKRQKSEYTKH